ncbi:hypothetical protein DQP57_00490 [Mycobacterium colombiense]|uniref:Uncharacterized protein n=1 Tax=Mycobacterium colombiense TaxID=339268 RepID=A0A329MIV2_9MYCO|nr:hypothetical protein [Mycobacterium colombiense]RAV17537.1 hypothetical protein DQP57_00490 [Mycobacterium colombiense]
MSEMGQKIIAEVRKIAAERPNFVYPRLNCAYLDEYGCPSCIIGHALFRLEVIPSVHLIEGKPASFTLSDLGIDLDHDEARWLDEVQAAQDGRAGPPPPRPGLSPEEFKSKWAEHPGRYPWGEAVKHADNMVPALAA